MEEHTSATISLLSVLSQVSTCPEATLPPHDAHNTDADADADDATSELEAVLYRIPKTDFHCHLNGSISSSLLAHLERQAHGGGSHEGTSDLLFFDSAAKRAQSILADFPTAPAEDAAAAAPSATARMHYCFSVFDNIYKLMTNLCFTRLAVQDMVMCAAAENIVAMEIRTSLRDGMTYGVSHGLPRRDDALPPHAEAAASRTVSKREYVEVVTSTVEHLLGVPGGVVDFTSGELTTRTAEWDETFFRIYGFLAKEGTAAEKHEGETKEVGTSAVAAKNATAEGEKVQRLRRILATVMRRLSTSMHVRLLLSVNRSAGVASAKEAAALATTVQQEQVQAFCQWCAQTIAAHARGTHDASTIPRRSIVAERLRRTCWVTGMDLSGNCYKGIFAELEPVLAAAAGKVKHTTTSSCTEQKSDAIHQVDPLPASLGLTYHGGEKQDPVELGEMITSGPERWGHLVYTDPVNLARILRSHDPIELCITSNLLTGGHSHVRDHHLTTLMAAWDAGCAEQEDHEAEERTRPTLMERLLDADVYSRAVSQRRERRVRRFVGTDPHQHRRHGDSAREAGDDTASEGRGRVAAAIPNVSFHTDDRGVFGTTAAHELALASQHPLVHRQGPSNGNASSMALVAYGMRALHRLSLLNLFDLHWAVMFLAVYTEEVLTRKGEDGFAATAGRLPDGVMARALSQATEGAGQKRPTPTSEDLLRMVQALPDVTSVTASASGKKDFSQLCAELSDLEWRWLTQCFDRAE